MPPAPARLFSDPDKKCGIAAAIWGFGAFKLGGAVTRRWSLVAGSDWPSAGFFSSISLAVGPIISGGELSPNEERSRPGVLACRGAEATRPHAAHPRMGAQGRRRHQEQMAAQLKTLMLS